MDNEMTEEMLDKMLEDLDSEKDELEELEELEGWDTSSKEEDYLHNHAVDIAALSSKKKVSDLTVDELRSILKEELGRSLPIPNYQGGWLDTNKPGEWAPPLWNQNVFYTTNTFSSPNTGITTYTEYDKFKKLWCKEDSGEI